MNNMADQIAQRIEERLCAEIKGFLAIPDDVCEWIMPIVREELQRSAAEFLGPGK